MIHFIIVDDKCKWLEQISSIIDKIMIKNNFEYDKMTFYEYDESFIEYSNQNLENKIYILDIETVENNGIDIARDIRKKDKDATIIFLTAYKDYSYQVLSNMIEALCFIYKNDDVETILSETIQEKLDRITKDEAIIKLEEDSSLYAIPISKILYITTDTKSRKSVIKTDFQKFYSKRTLKYFEHGFPTKLIRTHKSCVVNIKRVIDFDFKNEKILFNDRSTVGLLSKKYKKTIKENFLNNNV